MARTVTMIGVDPDELAWLRLLVSLLRHPDPVVPELARHALLYLQSASRSAQGHEEGVDGGESSEIGVAVR